MKKNIAIVAGGYSSEYEISVKSAKQIYDYIDKNTYNTFIVSITKKKWTVILDNNEELDIDKSDFSFINNTKKISFECVYIAIHGTPGEDGILQAYFDLLRIPYTSCNLFVSALTFNKFSCKSYLSQFDVTTAKSYLIRKKLAYDIDKIIKEVGLPCFVKPNNGGSSFGISKVKLINEMPKAIEDAFKEDSEVIIEAYIEGREISCGVLQTSTKKYQLPITEIITENEFFDYEAKYISGKTNEITPAQLSNEIKLIINNLTSKIYNSLGCTGMVRIDFIINNNTPYFLEINTVPGMSSESIIPKQLKANGYSITEIFSDIIEDALLMSKNNS